MKNTRVPGHGLLAEGRAHKQHVNEPHWRSVYPAMVGHGVCSCGAHSALLLTDAARKRWHAAHKNDVSAAIVGG